MNPYDIAHQLATALNTSEEYRAFLAAKEKVKTDAANTKMLADFQLKQFELQQLQMLGQEISQDKQQELERSYSLLSLNPSIKEYLEAEFRFSRLINDVQKILADGIQEAVPVAYENQ
ncbi:MAG TPA: YlbF family regulator [Candidatus Deferrimicrobium sp.]|nr:YlbF family regulator [Candidatus Deferrimicrobium sp.]